MTANLGKVVSEGVAWISASSMIIKVIGITYVVLVLGHLSVYEFGVVELLLSIPPLLGILSLPGLEAVITADMGREKGNGNQEQMSYIFSSYVSIRFLLAVVAWAILFFSAPYVEHYYNEAIGTMVQVLSFTFLFSPFRSMFLIVFRVALQYKLVALYRFLEEFGKLAILAVCLLYLEWGPLSVIMAYVGADIVALTCLSLFFVHQKRSILGANASTSGWRDPLYTIKAHGKWSIFGSYLELFGQNIRPWLIKFFLGTHAVGIYAVAIGMYQNTVSLIPINQVITPLIPQFIEKRWQLFQLLNSSIKYQLLASVLSAGAMIALLPILIQQFFPDYAAAYPLFVALLVTAIPASFSAVFQPVFFALKAQKDLFFANIVRLLSIVIILPLVLPLIGMYGLAIEFFITRSLYAINRYRKLHTLLPEYQMKLSELVTITPTDRLLYTQVTGRLQSGLRKLF